MTGLILALTIGALAAQSQAGQACLHGPDATPEQQQRRSQAIGAARAVNTAQVNQPGARERRFLSQEQFAALPQRGGTAGSYDFTPGNEVLPGWRLTLATTESGYWFIIKDTTDPCHFALVSNEEGIIYTAQPIR
jgi:hypothetical protein